MNKKLISILLVAALVMSLSACYTRVNNSNPSWPTAPVKVIAKPAETPEDPPSPQETVPVIVPVIEDPAITPIPENTGGGGSGGGGGGGGRPLNSLMSVVSSKKDAFSLYSSLNNKVKNICATNSESDGNDADGAEQYDIDMLQKFAMEATFDEDALIAMGATREILEEIGAIGPIEISVSVFTNAKYKAVGDSFQYSASIETNRSALGSEESEFSEIYSDGEKAYVFEDGIKSEIDMADLEDMIIDNYSKFLPDLAESDILDYKTEIIGDDTVISIYISGDVISEIMEKSGGGVLDSSVDEVEFDSLTLSLRMDKDGIPKNVNTGFTLSFSMVSNGIPVSSKVYYTSDIVFNKYGSGVEVDLSRIK